MAFLLASLLGGLAGLVAPGRADALRLPLRPAVAGSSTEISVAAAAALTALWSDDAAYADRLGELVPLVAAAARVTPEQLAGAWSSAPRTRMLVLLSALTQVGVPYKPRRAVPGEGFDCSGLTSWAWSQVGRYLPHQSRRQIRVIRASSKQRILPADIVYYPGHAMLALGVGLAMVHAPYPGRSVEVSPPTGRWWRVARVGTPDGDQAVLATPAASSTTTTG